jgi:hypothetical protein
MEENCLFAMLFCTTLRLHTEVSLHNSVLTQFGVLVFKRFCVLQCEKTVEGLVAQRQALKEFADSEAQAMKQTSEEMIQVCVVAVPLVHTIPRSR